MSSSSSLSQYRERKVALTGVTGFTAGHICEELLRFNADKQPQERNEHGQYDLFTVHCTVRSLKNSERYDFIKRIAEKYMYGPERVKFFEADLTKPGSFDEAFKDCEEVIHCAAVTEIRIKTCPFKDIITPGVEGAKEVARACERSQSVKRIVLTCSGSVCDMIEEHRSPENRGKPFKEDEVNLDLRPEVFPYVAEKTLSEKVLPEYFTRGPVISLLPTLIIGPQQNDEVRSSMQLLRFIANREASMVAKFFAAWIDVRDAAVAHRLALDMALPEEMTKRGERLRRIFVSSPEVIGAVDIARSMNKQFPNLNAPVSEVPNFLMWIASFFDDRVTDYVRLFLSKPRAGASQERMTNELKFKRRYENLDETIRDTLVSFGKFGIVPSKKLENATVKNAPVQ